MLRRRAFVDGDRLRPGRREPERMLHGSASSHPPGRREELAPADVNRKHRLGCSSIDFPEHWVDRGKNRVDVGEHVFSAEEIHRLKMRKARRAQFDAIGLIGAVGNEIDAEFAPRRLDSGIDFPWRRFVSLGVA